MAKNKSAKHGGIHGIYALHDRLNYSPGIGRVWNRLAGTKKSKTLYRRKLTPNERRRERRIRN